MDKKGVSQIVIFQDTENKVNVLADVSYFDKTSERIIWNNSDQRNLILERIDGYTIIVDKRI